MYHFNFLSNRYTLLTNVMIGLKLPITYYLSNIHSQIWMGWTKGQKCIRLCQEYLSIYFFILVQLLRWYSLGWKLEITIKIILLVTKQLWWKFEARFSTPPRPTEISMKNWSKKVQPVLTPPFMILNHPESMKKSLKKIVSTS